MFDSMFPGQRQASLAQVLQRPRPAPEEPGVFTGFGSALADAIPYAAVSGASAWAEVLDAYGKAAAFRDAPAAAMLGGRPAPDMAAVRSQTVDQMGDAPEARSLRRVVKRYAPDPEAVGVAGQIVHGVASSLAKAGLYAVAGGPLAPALYGLDVGVNRATELTDQGVDAGTAALAGATSGVAGAVGLKLPAALGATRLQSAAIGAVVNPALNVAEMGGIHALLDHADYSRIAAQYQPFDPISLAVATITGAAFGAGFHGAKGHAPAGKATDTPMLSSDEHAATLVMHEAQTRNADTLARLDDPQAMSAARDAQDLVRQQLDSGQEVSIGQVVDVDPERLRSVVRRLDDAPLGEALRAAAAEPAVGSLPGQSSSPIDAPVQPATQVSRAPSLGAEGSPASNVPPIAEAVQALAGRGAEPVPATSAPRADTPEQIRAFEFASRNPDAMLPTGETNTAGEPVYLRAADLVQEAHDIEQQARVEESAFGAAVNCALRFPR